VDWIAYDDHHRYWAGLHGGKDPAAAYRQFVKARLANPTDPKLERLRDWGYGGSGFIKRLLAMASGEDEGANRRRRRRMNPVTGGLRRGQTRDSGFTDAEGCRKGRNGRAGGSVGGRRDRTGSVPISHDGRGGISRA
jgi:hypothetical protein